jgi:hypothetical protein
MRPGPLETVRMITNTGELLGVLTGDGKLLILFIDFIDKASPI